MPLVVMLLVNLRKLVGEEKLAEAEKAVLGEFMNMGTTVSKNTESMECTVVRGNSIISLTIYVTQESFYGAGVAKIKVIHNHGCGGYYNTLQGILDYVMNTVANALNIDSDKVADAVERLEIGAIP
jgi:hypothetical protein